MLDVRIYRQPGHVVRAAAARRRPGRARCSPSATTASEALERARAGRGREYASSSNAHARRPALGFQPPAIGEEEIEAVAETLRSGWLTTGPRAALLEERMAEYLEAEHVLAVASGTAAMHLALLALGVGPGDEVITTPITWPATANVIVHCGATPVFADVREGDLNIDPELVAAAVTERTKAILPVHLAGQPADLDPSGRSASPWSRTPRTPPRAPTAAASSAGSRRRRASRSTRRRTSPPARAASSRRTAPRSRTRSATCA